MNKNLLCILHDNSTELRLRRTFETRGFRASESTHTYLSWRHEIRSVLESGSQSNLNIVRRWLLEIKRHCLRVNSSWLSMTNVSRQPRWVPRGWIEGVQESESGMAVRHQGTKRTGEGGYTKDREDEEEVPTATWEGSLTSIINNAYRRWRGNKKERVESLPTVRRSL